MNYHPTTVVYTDGSLVKVDDGVDVCSGFFVKQKDNAKSPNELGYGCYKLQEYNSIFQAEVTAMHRAAMTLTFRLRILTSKLKTRGVYGNCG